MLGLNQRKLQKFKKNPKLFFKDAIKKRILSLNDASKRCLPKECEAFTKYAIISAVYMSLIHI